jgi:hypothetical protein
MFSNLATLKHPVRCLKGKGDQQFHILPTATNTQTQMDLFFLKWGSPSLCIKEMHTACFYSFIQQRPVRGLTMIIQAETTKIRCQSTTKLVKMLEDWTRPCAFATAIVDSLVEYKESALCANSRGHRHLYAPTHLRSARL